ncbi:MAG: hypothetical protein ACFB4I_03255 [Cyanophyceae cyanobacterium]
MIQVHPKIIIGGVPRTGKSILAKKLFDRYHGLVMHGDTLVNAIKNNYKNAFAPNFDTIDTNNYRDYLLPMQNYLVKLVRNMGKGLDYNISIFESCYVLPESVAQLRKQGFVCSVFLLYNCLDIEQKIQDIRDYAKINPSCWSHQYTDSELHVALNNFTTLSRFLRQECRKYQVHWFDLDDQWSLNWYGVYQFITSQVSRSAHWL